MVNCAKQLCGPVIQRYKKTLKSHEFTIIYTLKCFPFYRQWVPFQEWRLSCFYDTFGLCFYIQTVTYIHCGEDMPQHSLNGHGSTHQVNTTCNRWTWVTL